MNKLKLAPLVIDKETVASLSRRQLEFIQGGKDLYCSNLPQCCQFGGSTDPVSTGCGAGGSTCMAG